MTPLSPNYPAAEAAGLPQLGGRDITIDHRGLSVRGHYWKADGVSRGRVMLCPGFTEFCEKHSATAAFLHAAGYDLLIIDWPGQGRSGHLARHALCVHADSFIGHLSAAETLMAAVGFDQGRIILMGHSMGGHLALRLTHRHQGRVAGLVVMSPMIAPPVMPATLPLMAARILVMLGLGRWLGPGQIPRSLASVRVHHPGNVLTRDAGRYEASYSWFDDQPDLRRSGASFGWIRAAYSSCVRTTLSPRWMQQLDLPVLALTAEDETVVHKASTDRMLAMLPNCDQHEFTDARHELYMETDDVVEDLYHRIGVFLKQLPG